MKMIRKRRSGGLVVAGVLLILAAGAAQANTCTWTGAWSTPPAAGDAIIIESGNLTWSSSMPSNVASWAQSEGYTGTVTVQTVYGATGFTNLTVSGDMVLNGGVLTHTTNNTAESYRLRVHVNGNLFITNAAISANAAGYARNRGPGVGGSAEAGGAYGGQGSARDNGVTVGTYGSVRAPLNLGSGGGGSSGGGPGGGAILLMVAGTTTVANTGMITANGGAGSSSSGGAGGSIYLTTGWLAGSGTIRANGAAYGDRSGGGGRVAIILTGTGADFTSGWSGANIAYGGGSGASAGAAGTVYLKTQAGEETLIIDNNNNGSVPGKCSTLMPAAPNAVNLNSFSNVVIRNKGTLGVRGDTTLDFSTFTPALSGSSLSAIAIDSDTAVTYPTNWILDNCTLYARTITPNKITNLTIGTNGVLSHFMNYYGGYTLNLTIAGNLTILSNGTINANAFGYFNRQGPGYTANTGGAYGGSALSITTVNTYGSVKAPTDLGSGGSNSNGGSGGGAIRLTVAGTTTVASAGIITANGGNGGSYGGAGGTIALTTGWLAGSGTLQANGGSPRGSGGRVSIVLTGTGADFNLWNGTNTAYGDTTLAAAGTVYRQAAVNGGAGTVIVDNRNIATVTGYTCLPAYAASTENLTTSMWVAQNKGRIGVVSNAVIKSLTMNTNSYLELGGKTLTTDLLTITNKVHTIGTYTAAELGTLVADSSGGSGRVVVLGGPKGTMVTIR